MSTSEPVVQVVRNNYRELALALATGSRHVVVDMVTSALDAGATSDLFPGPRRLLAEACAAIALDADGKVVPHPSRYLACGRIEILVRHAFGEERTEDPSRDHSLAYLRRIGIHDEASASDADAIATHALIHMSMSQVFEQPNRSPGER